MTKIYVAAPFAYAPHAFVVAHMLERDGHAVTSTWHRDTLGLGGDPLATARRKAILDVNLRDLRAAEVLVALTARGMPRATNAEIGFALALNMPVVWWQSPNWDGANIFDAHELVRVVTDYADIPAAVRATRGGQ
jgi:nucleoside 2-deoxyribosyltransferase